jgi:hypothetical protein
MHTSFALPEDVTPNPSTKQVLTSFKASL